MSPLPKNDERIELRVPAEDLERWRATAEAEGRTLSQWIRHRCNEVALSAETIAVVQAKSRERELARKGGRR